MADVAHKDLPTATLALDDKVLFADMSDGGASKNAIGVPVLSAAQTTAGATGVAALDASNVLRGLDGFPLPINAANVTDAAGLTLRPVHLNTPYRLAASGITYALDADTAWPALDGVVIGLPATGSVSVSVAGGATLNGATATLSYSRATRPSGLFALVSLGSNAYGIE